MGERPEYVACISRGTPGAAWCGRFQVGVFTFVNIDHACHNAENEGRLLICPECSAAIQELLQGHTYEGE